MDVNFVANAQSTTSYFWVFGDGDATTTYGNSVQHTYNDGGVFVPTLVIDDSIHNCQLTLISPDTITIIAGYADFSFSSYIPCSDSATIHFYDSSFCSQGITSYLWDFGDGQTSTVQSPSHLYNTNGTFDVTLTITSDSCSWTVTIQDVVTIFIPPLVDINADDTLTCYPPLVTGFSFNPPVLTPPAIGFDWDFGDGSPHSTSANPSHTYNTSGAYDVTVIIAFSNGCQHSYTETFNISVYPMPVAGFHSDTNHVFAGYSINFNNTSGGDDLTWYWDFGDGNSSSLKDPDHFYIESGTYPVMLIASTPNGCMDTATQLIYIIDLIIPNVFTPNGDGHNDIFAVDSVFPNICSGYSDFKLVIYNRWGKVVYENTNDLYHLYWDGKINDQEAAAGTYYFVLEMGTSTKNKSYKGTVTLLR